MIVNFVLNKMSCLIKKSNNKYLGTEGVVHKKNTFSLLRINALEKWEYQ
jgi:hypothetical protein